MIDMDCSEMLRRRIGARVRALRAGNGLTQLQLAGRSGISRPSIANVEAGRQNVGLRQLCRLAKALGVRVEDLLVADNALRQAQDDGVSKAQDDMSSREELSGATT